MSQSIATNTQRGCLHNCYPACNTPHPHPSPPSHPAPHPAAPADVANAVRAMRLAGGDQPTHNSPRESSTTGRTKWFTGGWFGKKPTGAHSVGSSEATTQAKGVASGTGLVLPSFPGADLPYQLGRQRTGSKAHFMIAQLVSGTGC